MFNAGDRHMLHGVSARLDLVLERLNGITAELVKLRQSEESIVQILKDMAAAEAKETELDYVTLTLTSP